VKKTEDTLDRNPGHHTLLRPAQVGRAGWSGSSIPGAPLNGGSPSPLGPEPFPRDRHDPGAARWVGRPSGARTGAACGAAAAVHLFGCC